MKQHDWFAANLFQPDLSINDFYSVGITPENTSIKSREDYKSNPVVIDAFTKEGKFDEQSYNTFYDNALLTYNQYSKSEFDKRVLEEYSYDPAEWRVSGNKKDTSTVFQLGRTNLRKEAYGVEGFGITPAPEFSTREIAQMNEVRDAEGNKLGYTPNEKGGLFKGLTRPTLVLAQWEDDEIEIINGREIVHKKGDLKLDENGNPYYEELGNRDIYGRDVLHYTDTLTDDDSVFNKYDFFDSDGLEKSFGGTLMKTLVNLAPYVISGTIGGPAGWIWGGVNATLEIARVLPTLGKAVNGIFGGDDNSALAQGLSRWEAALSRFDSSTSDATRNQPWSVETLGSLVSDIAGQLYQQRVISMVPGLLDKAGFTKGLMKNKKLGEELALGYMAATSARETYGSFREAGANEATAGIASIANLLALNGLMRTDYFRSTLFKGSFFDDDILKGVAKDVAREVRNNNTLDGTASKAALKKITQLYENKLRSKLTDYGGAMLREGLEEMMEESVSDLSQGITEGFTALGFKTTETGKTLDFGWSTKDLLTRYGMSFVGGALGGGIFNFSNDWNLRGQSDMVKQLDNSSLAKMSYLIAEGRTQELKDFYAKMYKKGLLGDPNLSASKFQTVTGINGENEIVAETGGKTQNDMIYEQLIKHIDYMETLISEEGLKIPRSVLETMASHSIDPKSLDDHRLLRAQALNLAAVTGGYLNDFNRLTAEIVKERANLDSLMAKYKGETDKERRESEDPKNNADVKKSLEKLKTLREERDAMLSGERMWFYTERGRFVMDEGTNRMFLDLSIEKFTEAIYGKRYVDLNESEKEEVDSDYQDYLNKEGKRNMFRAYEIYNKVSEAFAERLQAQTVDLSTRTTDTIHTTKTNVALLFEKKARHEEIQNRIDQLKSKETLDPEEVRELADLKNELVSIESEVAGLFANPNEALRGAVEDETSIRPIIGSGNITTASKLIKQLYGKYISGKVYVKSEDELSDFYRFSKMKQVKTMSERFIDFLNSWAESEIFNPTQEIPSDDFEEDFRMNDGELLLVMGGDGENAPQLEFVRLMQALETAIGTRSFKNKYQEVFNFIKANAKVSDEQARYMIASMLKISALDSNNQNVVEEFDLLKFIEEIDELRNQVYTSPIYDLLDSFSVEFSDGKLSILSVLEGEMSHLASRENLQDYIIRDPRVREELEKIAKFLNVLKGVVNGAYSGMNEASNKLRTSDMIKLAELDENSYRLLMDDISALQMKINDLWNLDRMNSADKLKLHKQTEVKLKPKQVKWMLSDGFVSGFEAEFGVNLRQLWSEINPNFDINDLDLIDDRKWPDFEAARIDFESAMYDAIKDKSPKDIVDSIFKLFGNNLYQMESTRINPATEVWTGYDMALYVMDITSMRASDFYQRYKEVLERTPAESEKKLAPVFGQELAIRRSVSMAANVEAYNLFMDKLKEQAGSDSSTYIQNKRTLHNVSTIFGGAGTGKTVAISKIVAEMLAFDDDIEFVYIAPGELQVEKLQTSVGKDGKQYTSDKFFEEFVEIDSSKIVYDEQQESMQFDVKIKKDVFSPGKSKKVIIVDESTLFDVTKWTSISKIAEAAGAVVVALGDLKQNQARTKVKYRDKDGKESSKVIDNGIEDFVGVRSPLLTTSLRAGNEAKFQNASILDEKLSRVIAQSHTKSELREFDEAFNSENTDGFRMGYYNAPDGSAFVGELFIQNDSEASVFLRRFANEPGATVAYITDKENFELPPDIAAMRIDGEAKVKVIRADQAQGGEFDYVIVDKKWTDSSTFNTARDLYTLTQRSIKGTVIVNRGITDTLKIENYSDQNLVINSAPDDGVIQEFADWKLQVGLGNISVVSSHFSSYFPVNPHSNEDQNNKDDENDENDEDSDDSGDDDIPADNSEDITEDTSEDKPEQNNTPDQHNDNQSGKESDQSKATGDTDVDTGEVIPDNWGEPDFDSSLDFFPTEYNGTETNPTDEVRLGDTSIKPLNRVRTQEQNYHTWLSNGGAYKTLRKDVEISETQYAYLVPQIASAIKAGYSKEEFITNIMMNPIMGDAIELEDFLNNSTLEIWIENFNDKHDVVIAKFIGLSSGKPEFHIPLTFIEKGHVGKYTGKFHLYSGPKFTKGEWISLSQLAKKYPGLRVLTQWGVYSSNPDAYDFVAQKHADEHFISRNNGKVMTFMTEDGYQYTMFDQSSIWEHGVGYVQETKPDGTRAVREVPWTHQNYKETQLFGIERTVSIEDFMKFLHIRHDRYSGTLAENLSNIGIDSANEFEQRVLATDEVFKTKPGKNEDNTAFQSQMQNRRFQIVNVQTRNAIFKFVFNNLSTWIGTRFGNDVLHSLRFLQNASKTKFVLKIKNRGKHYYLYYVGGKYSLFESTIDDNGKVYTTKNAIKSFELVNHQFPITDILNFFGGQIDNVEIGFIGSNNSIPSLTTNEQLYRLFWDITRTVDNLKDSTYMEEIEHLFRSSKEFKHGIFTNIAGGNFHVDNCSARRFIGEQGDFLTDASEWTYPIYLMDLQSVERGTHEEIEQQSDTRVTLEEDKDLIKKLIKGILDVSKVEPFISGMKSTEEILNYVNGLLFDPNHWTYKQIIQDETGEFKLQTVTSREKFLQDKLREFGFDGVNIEYRFLDSCKTAIFSVSLQGYILRMNSSNEWEVVKFKSFPKFKEVFEKVKILESQGHDVTSIKAYLRDSVADTHSVDIKELYENQSFGLVVNQINDYLLERLNKEEC